MISIAIDGPAGAGKTAVSGELAKKLDFLHFDTGALYRAVAYFFIKNDLCFSDEEIVSRNLRNICIDFEFKDKTQKMYLINKNDKIRYDITKNIRSENISKAASKVSAFSLVRKFLLDTQHQIANQNNVIMDGRDIGTFVLPNADLKFFLTASLEERAYRRFKQIELNNGNNEKINYNEVLSSIQKRDAFDSQRENCPLQIAADAIVYNSTGQSFEKSVQNLLQKIKEKLNKKLS
ncbi:MAG: (d)CMP kinase [Oscillospiraceae bacterium]|nr:(d)CMP kinase [Oscillospiraceae bacterium]